MIIEKDGILEGPFRRPVNPTQNVAGSIHNDATAKKLGFRGGTIAGSIHMEQFPPLLLHAFGERWLERGGLSLYFQHATTHLEPVRCLAEVPDRSAPSPQIDVWMENESGARVCEGTAWTGEPDEPSALRRRIAELRPASELRMLKNVSPGDPMGERAARVEPEAQQERVARVSEPLDVYVDGDHPVATAAAAIQALRRAESGLVGTQGVKAVGLFGAIELEHLRGPVHVARDYVASGRVLAVGDTPKTEFFWYESELREPDTSGAIARMIMMIRFMKGSSSLWQSA